ncbi:ATPase-like protein [Croceitalea dokdonensis DOKDO 023]|uniref:ATPase-like protein n=1 Tax=Croceitalea dokdonensis DOKDO 023 TaxID=1300341 RepID=A0A0P7AP03_9FLAO|nr:ATP-binding protein [Croceitalea dokdonensis]KPM33789.1 ATPase-like protein [Croceitalea dokdonensis DOKDO 023]
MLQKRIVITGAPGTGKTAVIDQLETDGFFCFHEVIRKMTAAAKAEDNQKNQVTNPLLFVEDPMLFNTNLLALRKEDFHKAKEYKEQSLFFYDRGMPDVMAYMDYFGQSYPHWFREVCEKHSYDKVYVMPPWSDIYRNDNERLETFEEAKALDTYLTKTYQALGYQVIVVPKTTIEKRVEFILNTLIGNP